MEREELLSLLAKAWDDGVDFTGAALRAGCSLDEAANGNPYRPNPFNGRILANEPSDPSYVK